MEVFKGKKQKIRQNDILKSFFIILFLAIFLLAYINNTYLQFWFNDFSTVFKSNLQVYCLDVGQASSTLVVLPNKMTMLIDTGSGDSERKMLQSVETILNENDATKIDFLVLSHPDEDHVGGAVAILERYQVDKIFRPKVLSTSELEVTDKDSYNTVTTSVYADVVTAIYQEPNCQVAFMEEMSYFLGDNLYIKFWAAQNDNYTQTNSYSPFIYLEYIGKTFLFACDATAEREQEFISQLSSQNTEISVDFLFVAHHGSKYSSTTEFLEFISPQTAIISAGDDTHPSNEVLQRLASAGVSQIYVTKSYGTIGIGVGLYNKTEIKTLSQYLDLPFCVVVIGCVLFVYLRFALQSKRKKRNFSINF